MQTDAILPLLTSSSRHASLTASGVHLINPVGKYYPVNVPELHAHKLVEINGLAVQFCNIATLGQRNFAGRWVSAHGMSISCLFGWPYHSWLQAWKPQCPLPGRGSLGRWARVRP